SNHDSPRVASRLGERESLALAIFLLALPGSFYIYNGQELSLPDAQLLDSDRQDPVYFRTEGKAKGRDGARVPLPWNSKEINFGFSRARPWLPIPQEWQSLCINRQEEDFESSLNLYRLALSKRREIKSAGAHIKWESTGGDGCLSFARENYLFILNTTNSEITYEVQGRLLLASDSKTIPSENGIKLAPLSSCWVNKRVTR
ncbi:MAG: alpha-amylase family glycosyl hydrolase, partial [Candidatus Planktophila sp.]